jgi:hypothetical protein
MGELIEGQACPFCGAILRRVEILAGAGEARLTDLRISKHSLANVVA